MLQSKKLWNKLTILNLLKKNSDILAARIEDSYEEYVNMMENKMKNNNVPLDGIRIIIDSFDGAEHKRTTKGWV